MPRRRPRSTNIVGVVIDGDVIRGTHIRDVLGRPRVVRCAEVGIDATVTDHGRIVDHEAFTGALRRLWDEAGFRTKNVAFGIDGRDATFRRLGLPVEAGADVDTAARYELSSYLPYALDEAVTTVQEVGRDADNVDVVVVAVRRKTLEDLADAVTGAGLRLRDVTLAPAALAVSATGGSPGDSTIVSVDGGSTTIVVRRDGRATVTRVLTGGGGDRNAQAAEELEEALASVDQFRMGLGAHVERSEDPRLRRFRAVAEEVAAAIRFEESQQNGSTEGLRVELAGAYGADDALVELMAAGVDAPVSVVPAPDWWPEGDSFPTHTTSAGVALCAFDRAPGIVHLDVPSLTARRATRRELAVGVGAALLVALPVAQLVQAARDDAAQADENALAAELEAEVLAVRVESLDDVAVLSADVEDERRIRADALEGEIWVQRVLDEVADTIPDDTFLTGITLRRPVEALDAVDLDPTATFSGVALDQGGAAEWLLAVESLELIEELWLVQSTASVFGESEAPVVAFVGEGHLTSAAATPRSLGVEQEMP